MHLQEPFFAYLGINKILKTMEQKTNIKTIGAAWIKQSKSGKDYLSISFDDKEHLAEVPRKGIFAFLNQKKSQPNSPDYQLTIFTDKEIKK